jgi:hypothetical protein
VNISLYPAFLKTAVLNIIGNKNNNIDFNRFLNFVFLKCLPWNLKLFKINLAFSSL